MSVQPVEAAEAPWSAREVTTALFNHFTAQSWAPLVEVTVQPEVTLRDALADNLRTVGEVWEQTRGRRIDMLLARRPRKAGIGSVERLAVEVKVSRADFLSDIRNPYKQQPARDLAHRHAFAVPKGLVDPAEVPAGSGLIVVERLSQGNMHARLVSWAKRAPYKDPPPGDLPDWMILTYAFRAAWAEARVKGYTVDAQHEGDDPDVMRATIEKLRGDCRRAEQSADRAKQKADAWRLAYAGAAGIPCATCGQPIKPSNLRDGTWTKWAHVSRGDNAACEAKRSELAEHNAQAAWDKLTSDPDPWDQRAAERARETNPARPWAYLFHLPPIHPVYDFDQETDRDD